MDSAERDQTLTTKEHDFIKELVDRKGEEGCFYTMGAVINDDFYKEMCAGCPSLMKNKTRSMKYARAMRAKWLKVNNPTIGEVNLSSKQN